MGAIGGVDPGFFGDRFFGSPVRIWGRRIDADEQLFHCACSLRTAELSDSEAVSALVNAAQRNRRALNMLAEQLQGRRWTHDPLLAHIANLVTAAATARERAPLDPSDEETVRLERQLLGGTDAEAFDELARRCSALLELAAQAADPDWVAATMDDASLDFDPERDGYVGSDKTPRIVGWLWARFLRHVERQVGNDPRIQRFEAEHEWRVLTATRDPLGQLLGPVAVTDDPLLRTEVAFEIAWAHLRTTALGPPLTPLA